MKIPTFLSPFASCFGARTQRLENENRIQLNVLTTPPDNAQVVAPPKKSFYPNSLQNAFKLKRSEKHDLSPAKNLPSLSGSDELMEGGSSTTETVNNGKGKAGIGSKAAATVTESSTAKATSSLDKITDQASAMAAIEDFKKTLLEQGKEYRINDQERAEFITAFKQLFGPMGETFYKQTYDAIEGIRKLDMLDFKSHPELAHIPTPDLVAIRQWTSEGVWPLVQDALEGGLFDPEKNWHDPGLKVAIGARDLKDWEKVRLVLPYVKTFISALNSLPAEYDYKGKVFTGETQSESWVSERYQKQQDRTDWRFFATAKSTGGMWKNQTVNWETTAVKGKLIEIFSENPQEGEVMIAPPAYHTVKEMTRKENSNSPNYPFYNIIQQQKEHP